jgi:hypothetical protein
MAIPKNRILAQTCIECGAPAKVKEIDEAADTFTRQWACIKCSRIQPVVLTHIERYRQILAGRGMKVGDQVICEYRTPTPHQWWCHPWWVGVIEEVSDDAGSWNGHNSEAYYCANYKYVKVRYLGHNGSAGFTQHDQLGSLRQLHGNAVSESPHFGSGPADAIRLYQFACRAGLGDRYAEESQKTWHELNRKEAV